MEKKQRFSIWCFLVVFLPLLAIQNLALAPHPEILADNEFKTPLKSGKREGEGVFRTTTAMEIAIHELRVRPA